MAYVADDYRIILEAVKEEVAIGWFAKQILCGAYLVALLSREIGVADFLA
jgi:hypothetical protein